MSASEGLRGCVVVVGVRCIVATGGARGELRRSIGACSSMDVGASHADSCKDTHFDRLLVASFIFHVLSEPGDVGVSVLWRRFRLRLGRARCVCVKSGTSATQAPEAASNESNSPYAPRPIFIALWSSLVIMKGEELQQESARGRGREAARLIWREAWRGCHEDRVD